MTTEVEALNIAIGSVLAFNGIVLTVIWWWTGSRTSIEIPAFGACWLLYGVRALGQVEALKAAAPIDPVLWDRITYGAYYAQGIASWVFVEAFWRTSGMLKVFRRFWQFHVVFTIVAIGSDTYLGAGGTMLQQHVALLLVYVTTTIVHFFTGHIRYEAGTRTSYVATVIAATIILHDALARLGLLPWTQLFGPIGMATLAVAISYNLLKRAIDNETRVTALETELATALKIQKSLLPRRQPGIASGGFSVRHIPADLVGGDFYDVIPVDERRFGVLVADVTGHGIPAALIANLVKMASVANAASVANPSRFLAGMNADLIDQLNDHFVTAACAYFDLEAGELHVSSAGHPYPILTSRHRPGAEEIGTAGAAIGMLHDEVYPSSRRRITAGDRVVFYSDGLTEATAPDGEMFALRRFRRLLQNYRLVSSERCAENTLEQLARWRQQSALALDDDLTLLIVDIPDRPTAV